MARLVKVLLAIALVAAPVAWSPPRALAGSADPRLLFSAEDVPGLKAKVGSGVAAKAWADLLYKAEVNLLEVYPELAASYSGQNQMPTYLIDLAFAYVISGDKRFGRRAIDLMLALDEAGWPVWLSADGVSRDLGNGDLNRGLALAYDWTRDLMSDDERLRLVTSLVAQIPPLSSNGVHESVLFSCLDPDWWGNGGVNNWLGVCGGGAGLLLLAIEGEPGAGDLAAPLARARERTLQHIGLGVGGNANYGVHGDGGEGVTYALYGLKNALPFAFAWQRSRGEDLTAINPGLKDVPLWLAYEQQPGEGSRFVPRNDSNSPAMLVHELGPMFFDLRPDDGVSPWLWEHTAGPAGDAIFSAPHPPVGTYYNTRPDEALVHFVGAGYSPQVFTIIYYVPPAERPLQSPAEVAPLGRHYPEHGLVNFRTGFSGTDGDVTGVFEARRRAPGHIQQDLGHFSLYGYGAKFALDSGYTGGVKAGTVSLHDSGTAAGHNVLILGGQRLTQYGLGSWTGAQTIPYFSDAPNLTFVRSDLRAAYSADPAAVPWADRNLLFGRVPGEPVILAVSDNLRRNNVLIEHAWQLHTDGTHAVSPTGAGSFVSVAPNGAAMAGAVAEAAGPRVIAAYPWPKPVYSLDTPATHTLVTSRDPLLALVNRIDHLAVLAITPPGTTPATTAPLPATGGTAVSVTWSGGEILVGSAAHGSDGVSGAVTMTGSFGKVTRDRGETVLDQGTYLAAGGREYVTASAPSSVLVSGDEVAVHGPAGTTYRVYAPQDISRVSVNDAAVAFVRDGDYVSFPRQDFTIALDPAVLEQKKNADASATVTVAPVFGFSTPVDVSVAGLPSGFAVSFDAPRLDPGSSATLTLRAGPMVRPGTYRFEVVGEASGLRRSTWGSFVVVDEP